MSGRKETALNVGLLWLRILAGAGIATFGYGKVFGGQIEMLKQGVAALGFPVPGLFSWLAALTEFAGGLLIVAGLLTRGAAFFLFVTMCVAFFGAHAGDPFPVKLPAFLFGAIAGTLVLTGGGRFSLDALLCRRCGRM